MRTAIITIVLAAVSATAFPQKGDDPKTILQESLFAEEAEKSRSAVDGNLVIDSSPQLDWVSNPLPGFVNQPELVKKVLNERPDDFPKSEIIRGALYTLLGEGVFVSNGEKWKQQRRIIDPAFEGGRLRDVFPSMRDAGEAAIDRLQAFAGGDPVEIEEEAGSVK